MEKRKCKIEGESIETKVNIEINLDGEGKGEINTGIRFLDHLLYSFARYGLFDLNIDVSGDLDVHHTIENIGIVLGKSFAKALGDRKGIRRISHSFVPMDESLAMAVVDVRAHRGYAVTNISLQSNKIGDISTDLFWHLIEIFAIEAKINIHARTIYGKNDHHKVEALFKAVAKAIGEAIQFDREIPCIEENIKYI